LPSGIPPVTGVEKPLYALKYIDTVVGTGPLAEPTVLGTSQADSKVEFYTVRYTGWLAKDGTKFDSSYDHPGGEPIVFPYGVHRVIPGWDTGFEGMHVGGKRRIFVPWQLAYGASGRPPVIPPNSDLIFDVELVAVSDKPPTPPAPPTPPHPAAAPAEKSTVPEPEKPATPTNPPTPPPASQSH
jgi:peptidylprolyl isomerase